MIRVNRICEKMIWLLTLFFVVAIYVFYSQSWGRYVYVGIALAIFLLTVILRKGRIVLSLGRYHIYVLAFAIYCLLSSLWALDPKSALAQFTGIFSTLICMSLLYPYYSGKTSVKELLDILMWAGYILAVYSIYYYGYDVIYMASTASNLRLENTYNNINSISMLCAIACVIQVYRIIFRGFSFSVLFSVPTLIVVAAMQSRKAILILVLGIFLVSMAKNAGRKDYFQKLFRFLLIVVGLVILLMLFSRLPIFAGVNQRIEHMINSFSGNGVADRSSILRAQMREIGMQQFWRTPLLGIGIGSSRLLTYNAFGIYTYLHNNYVELLSCGGIIAAVLYYFPFLTMGKAFLRGKNFTRYETAFCAVLLVLLLVWDYGAVSYNSKIHYFFLMVLFIRADQLEAEKDVMECVV